MSKESLAIKHPWHLPARQQQILRLLADARTTEEIASDLGISSSDVEYHRMRLMKRVRLFSYQELTKLAVRLRMTNLDV